MLELLWTMERWVPWQGDAGKKKAEYSRCRKPGGWREGTRDVMS